MAIIGSSLSCSCFRSIAPFSAPSRASRVFTTRIADDLPGLGRTKIGMCTISYAQRFLNFPQECFLKQATPNTYETCVPFRLKAHGCNVMDCCCAYGDARKSSRLRIQRHRHIRASSVAEASRRDGEKATRGVRKLWSKRGMLALVRLGPSPQRAKEL